MNLKVCVGSSCHLRGSEKVILTFRKLIEKNGLQNKIELEGSFCMGKCNSTEVTVLAGSNMHKVSTANAEKFFNDTVLPLAKK